MNKSDEMERLTGKQKKTLEMLLDRYESSKSYRGENRVKQSFRVKPEEIWPPYRDNFTDVSEVDEFERELDILVKRGLVRERLSSSGEIRELFAIEDRIPEYYTLLGRKEKRRTDLEERQLYEENTGRKDALGAFCRDQLALLEAGHSARYKKDRAESYIALMKRILDNTEELYERELSTEVLKDSKRFEQSYRRTLCDILQRYGSYEDIVEGESEDRIIQLLILESHRIFANPGYVYVKGAAKLFFRDKSIMELKEGLPLGLSSAYIDSIERIWTESDRIITIENLTAFHRFEEEGFFCIYLAGYHSHRKTEFLKKISSPDRKQWFHFGDLDPDGFLILKNLRQKSGLDFKAYHMEAELLTKYAEYARALERNDIIKAENLIGEGFYPGVLKEMSARGIKLEQEVLYGSHSGI